MNVAPRLHHVDRVDGRLDQASWRWAEHHRARIEAHWSKPTSANPDLFNGQVLIATERRLSPGRLRVRYAQTDYASFLTFRDLDFPEAGTGNGFGMAALCSSDRRFVLGVMAPHTANAGQIYFPAGTPEPADVRQDGSVDLLANVLRELEEETGIAADEGSVGPGWTVVIDGGRTVPMRRIDVPWTAAALQSRLDAFLSGQSKPEFCGFRLVGGPDDIDQQQVPSFVRLYLRWAFANG